MKITRKQLRQLIKEEAAELNENGERECYSQEQTEELAALAKKYPDRATDPEQARKYTEEHKKIIPSDTCSGRLAGGPESLDEAADAGKSNSRHSIDSKEHKMKITRKQLRQIIKEELNRTLLENDPFAGFGAEFDSALSGDGLDDPGFKASDKLDKMGDKHYPADEKAAKEAIKKMEAEIKANPKDELNIGLKYGLDKYDPDYKPNQRLYRFKKRGGGIIDVIIVG